MDHQGTGCTNSTRDLVVLKDYDNKKKFRSWIKVHVLRSAGKVIYNSIGLIINKISTIKMNMVKFSVICY